MQPGDKQKAQAKTARIPIKVVQQEPLKKPAWKKAKTVPRG